MAITIPRPKPGDHAAYYSKYVDLVPDGDVASQLEKQGREIAALLARADDKRSQHRYAEGKWSIREVIGHVADTERVFAFRAMAFARGDAAPLPSMDQDVWAAGSNAHERSLADLAAELAAIRASTVAMLRSFGPSQLARSGVASGNQVTVGALAWIVAGHELHHVKILREKYGLR